LIQRGLKKLEGVMPSKRPIRERHMMIARKLDNLVRFRCADPTPERKYSEGDYVHIIATGVVTQVTGVTSYGFYRLAGQTNEFPASALEPADPP
jgi:hypothetical protein